MLFRSVAVGILYKEGYFIQKLNKYGEQENNYVKADLNNLPIEAVKDSEGKDLKITVDYPEREECNHSGALLPEG